MARYRRPPDPRKPGVENDWALNERLSQPKEPIPWRWLALGVLVAIFGLLTTGYIINAFLDREPLQVSLPTPTIVVLTAPVISQPAASVDFSTATPLPTFTPPPTADLSIAPDAITVGYYARVANTDDIGVSLRAGPSTDNLRLLLVPEDTSVFITGGPQEGNGFVWWQAQLEDGTEGWIAGDFLVPSSRP